MLLLALIISPKSIKKLSMEKTRSEQMDDCAQREIVLWISLWKNLVDRI
jgi:hypothetical protein